MAWISDMCILFICINIITGFKTFKKNLVHHYEYSSKTDLLGKENATVVIHFRVHPINESQDGSTFHELRLDSIVIHTESGYTLTNPMKWDLSKHFQFEVSSEGLIGIITHHHDDANEAVILKKTITSLFSGKTKNIKLKDMHSFENEETDHLGDRLRHTYTVQGSQDGFRIHRSFSSNSTVYRKHTKTFHYNQHGDMNYIKANDEVHFHGTSDAVQEKRPHYPGEYKIEESTTGGFQKLKTTSETSVRLLRKTVPKAKIGAIQNAVSGSLVITVESEEKKNLSTVNTVLQKKVKCILSKHEGPENTTKHFHKNTTDCVADLYNIVTSLEENEYQKLAESEIRSECRPENETCKLRKELFIDIVSKKEDSFSQHLIVKVILNNSNPDEREVERCLMHSSAIRKPKKVLVTAVMEMCTGKDNSLHGSQKLSATQRRACLTLGSLIKTLSKDDIQVANRLVESLETWLQHHNESHTKLMLKPELYQSVTERNLTQDDYIQTKLVLIHALGNAGMNRSLNLLLSYMQPNVGISRWRRAAIDSMRHIASNESATALLDIFVHDDNDLVKQVAVDAFVQHPKGKHLTDERKHIIQSKNYTYPILMRLKRGLIDISFNDGIYFALNLPGIEWRKTVGGSAVGAQFGLVVRNRLELEIKPLSGYFEVDLYNHAYTSITIGFIGLDIEVFRAMACFKGYFAYDLNILKDFGIDSVQDLARIFDKVADSVIGPVLKALDQFRQLIEFFKSGGIQKVFELLVTFVKSLPSSLENLIQEARAIVETTFNFGKLVWIERIQKISKKIRTSVEDIQEDIVQFYHRAVDALTVTLPYVGKQLTDALKSMMCSVKLIVVKPMQALSSLTKTVMKIKLAISMFVELKKTVVDALFWNEGKQPLWLNVGEYIKDTVDDIEQVIEILSKGIFVKGKQDHKDTLSTNYTDGIALMEEQSKTLKEKLQKKNKEMLLIIKVVEDFAKTFLERYKDIMDAVKSVKSVYINLKKWVAKGKSIVQKIFGPKFHANFPKRRRPNISPCGSGMWPSTSGGEFKTTGIDLRVPQGREVVSPFSGMARKNGNRVVIKPVDNEFEQTEMVIENIDASDFVSDTDTYVSSGSPLGRATTSRCSPNFIHISLRKRRNDDKSNDGDYEYVDPSPYLGRVTPQPLWKVECNEYIFRHIFETTDLSTLADPAKAISKKLKRGFKDMDTFTKDIDSWDDPDFNFDTDSDFGDFNFNSNTAPNNKRSGFTFSGFGSLENLFSFQRMSLHSACDEVLSNFCPKHLNSMQMFDFSSAVASLLPKIDYLNFVLSQLGFNILDAIDLGSLSLQKVLQMLDFDLSGKLEKLIDKVINHDKNTTKTPLLALPTQRIWTLWGKSLLKSNGDINSWIAKILYLPQNDCPTFLNAIVKGIGILCSAHKDCRGLTCGIPLNYGIYQSMVNLDIRVNVCHQKLWLTHSERVVNITLNGTIHLIKIVDMVNLGMEYILVVSGRVQGTVAILEIKSQICVKGYLSCLENQRIFDKLKIRDSSYKEGDNQDDHRSGYYSIIFADFISMLSDRNLLDKTAVDLTSKIREYILSLLFGKSSCDALVAEEFPDKQDVCQSGDVDFPKLHIPFIPPEIPPIKITVGPVVLVFEFGASGALKMEIELEFCFLSMVGKTIVTPSIAGKVWGSVGLALGPISAGLKLIGYVLQTEFPITLTLKFNKFPLDIAVRMDLRQIPLQIVLKAFVKLDLFLAEVTLFEGVIFRFSTPIVVRNIFTTPKDEKDESPPKFQPLAITARKRSVTEGCLVTQLPNLNPQDTAFMLEASPSDEVSNLAVHYVIGTQHGGTDVVDWTEMGGFSLVVPTSELPNGIPLYWTVRASNSQGLGAFSHCELLTYDNTIPDGRVDASYIYSSHPKKLSATVSVFDDTPLNKSHQMALGYSSGEFGSEVEGWTTLILDKTTMRKEITNDLKYFNVPKKGKLSSQSFHSLSTRTDLICAQECLKFSFKCVSFDYEYHTEKCDLQEFVIGPSAELRVSGTYKNYERLGIGHSSFITYDNIECSHGRTYFVNVLVENILGYRSFLVSSGTMVDFTPPDTGPLGKGYTEDFVADGCSAATTQRCVDVTWKKNHRIIRDGLIGSGTVFNGHKPLTDNRYTLANHYMSVNFDGFHDNETGIWGYTWSSGTSICGDNTVSERDPHAHHSHSKYWTHTGYARDIFLPDGIYFVTVKAINSIVHGGALVTTVCHTTPYTVDTTPPTFQGVSSIYFDEYLDLLGLYYQAYDGLSQLYSVDFGLGKTKHDVKIRGYSRHAPMTNSDPFLVVPELALTPGVPAWVRIRAENNVFLFTTGHGEQPILVDRTPPVTGTVLDGSKPHRDLSYQSSTNEICAQWVRFYDEESGILRFIWGIGTKGGLDNIVTFNNFTHHEHHGCVENLNLEHNRTYYSTVVAFNAAINLKSSNVSSDGVLVDTTPPVIGWINDGGEVIHEMEFSSHMATKSCTWDDFRDAESHIEYFRIDVYINQEFKKTFFRQSSDKTFTDHSLSMNHLDTVKFSLLAMNKAGLSSEIQSNGYLVDHTPPVLKQISINPTQSIYQSSDEDLTLSWEFMDNDSGIKEYKYYVNVVINGEKSRHWPSMRGEEVLPITNNTAVSMKLENQQLINGAKYTLHVISTNNALMSTSHESEGVIVDVTPPVVTMVHIGTLSEDEELNNEGQVLHVDPFSVKISVRGRDSESDVNTFLVAVGTSPGDTSATNGFRSFRPDTVFVIKNIVLSVFEESGNIYYISVKAKNGANLESDVFTSKPVILIKGNVPGTIYDGRTVFIDEDFSTVDTSLALSFEGFKSEACNIQKYEWAIGSEEYETDIMAYTNIGLVLHNNKYGHAQMHLDLQHDQRYFTTVRAKTGHKCHDRYLVSSSDGIKVDTKEPYIHNVKPKQQNDSKVVTDLGNFYQSHSDSLDYLWQTTDSSPVKSTVWSVGTFPYLDNVHRGTVTEVHDIPPGNFNLDPGQSVFLTLVATDEAGNIKTISTSPITSDTSPPTVINLTCSHVISEMKSSIICNWDTIVEYESRVVSVSFGVGTKETETDVMAWQQVQTNAITWSGNVLNVITDSEHTSCFVSMNVTNVLKQVEILTRSVTIDRSVPTKGEVFIVTRLKDESEVKERLCQVPQGYVETRVNDFSDTESGIDGINLFLGLANLKYTHNMKRGYLNEDLFFSDNLALIPGSKVESRIRVYNKAGLYTSMTSKPVVVSPDPELYVADGPGDLDIDYQKDMNVIQGFWKYSHPCPVLKAEWTIEDIAGNIVQDYISIPVNDYFFVNDELNLQNKVLYIVKVRVTDALNRTKTSKSDGVTVQIGTPYPGKIRDGLSHTDINYQFPIDVLSANWDEFGNSTSEDPIQVITHYEIAVGNDKRYATKRINIHSFFNVGLNLSSTINNLNLTAKLVTYYVTVRGYNLAGSYEETYSNGIRVGFRDEIVGCDITGNSAQHETSSISVSWSACESDMGIKKYFFGLTSTTFDMNSSMLTYPEIENISRTYFDVLLPRDVGVNTITNVENLNLKHGYVYYPVVICVDESNMCRINIGNPVLIDTTPPTTENLKIFINDRFLSTDDAMYVTNSRILQVQWDQFNDNETVVDQYDISLLELSYCSNIKDNKDTILNRLLVKHVTACTFYDLSLKHDTFYKITIKGTNAAGLFAIFNSSLFRIDDNPAFSGSVHIGSSWYKKSSFQYSTNTIMIWTAIARSYEDYFCENQIEILPSILKPKSHWRDISQSCSENCVVGDDKKVILKIGYNTDLTSVQKAALQSGERQLMEGNYTIALRSAKGEGIFTAFFIASSAEMLSTHLLPPIPDRFLSVVLNTSVNDNAVDGTQSDNLTSTTKDNYKVNQTSTITTSGNYSNDMLTTQAPVMHYLKEQDYGFGLSILASRQNGSKVWDCQFWATDKYQTIEKWFTLNADPTENFHKYIIKTSKGETEKNDDVWNLELFVDGDVKASITGVNLKASVHFFIQNTNVDGHVFELKNPFEPFRSSSTIESLKIPLDTDKPCLHGRGFFDEESGIHYISVGVSDNLVTAGNIKGFERIDTFCKPCKRNCSIGCDRFCELQDSFQILQYNIKDLLLHETIAENNDEEVEVKNTTTYYVHCKVVNFAGQETIAVSNGINIDTSPPVCEYMRCLDPRNSMDAPTEWIGSNKTVGAYWSCKDDMSGITENFIRVSSKETSALIHQEKSIEQKSNVQITLPDGVYFEHRKQYIVHLRTVNMAGMSREYSCKITVDLKPPNIDNAKITILFNSDSNPSEEKFWTYQNDRLGISWNNSNDEAEFYEWQVDTFDDSRSIIPSTKVGMSRTGRAFIRDDRLWLNDKNTNMSVDELRMTNLTSKYSTKSGTGMLHLEPGKCVVNTLYARSKSHLLSKSKPKVVCYVRERDAILNKSVNGSLIFGKPVNEPFSKLTENYNQGNMEIILNITGFSGEAVIGDLSSDDLVQTYGSAASSDYTPYISDPRTTYSLVSRVLKHRIVAYRNTSFFVSPTSAVSLKNIGISIQVSSHDYRNGTIPVIALWKKSDENQKAHWRLVEEGCSQAEKFKTTSNFIKSNVCFESLVQSENRRKRSAGHAIDFPMQFSVLEIKQDFANSPPVLDTTFITTNENTPIINYTLLWHDEESDEVNFYIRTQPRSGICNITTDGRFTFIPERNFIGNISMEVAIKENPTTMHQNYFTSTTNLLIEVQNINDAPIAVFLQGNGSIYDSQTDSSVVCLVEGNTTDHFLGTLFTIDKDETENLAINLNFRPATSSIYFNIKEDNINILKADLVDGIIAMNEIRTLKYVNISIDLLKAHHGVIEVNFLGHDKEGFYTSPFTLHVYVLLNPCLNGECSKKQLSNIPCFNTIRAHTFSPYVCKCLDGYSGRWCENEIDECQEAECGWLYDCEDKINNYLCIVNGIKLFCLVLILVLVIMASGILIFKLKSRWSRRNAIHPKPRDQNKKEFHCVNDKKETQDFNYDDNGYPHCVYNPTYDHDDTPEEMSTDKVNVICKPQEAQNHKDSDSRTYSCYHNSHSPDDIFTEVDQ